MPSKRSEGGINSTRKQSDAEHETARCFISALRAGNAPWRYPHNRLPEFVPLFGDFFTGKPLGWADADYGVVDDLVRAVGVKIRHHWNCGKPRYLREQDRIVLPLKSYFQDEAHYRATLLHELFHAVEQPHRAGWTGPGHQGELIAEAATGIISSRLRLPHDTDNKNLDKYLAWWAMEITFDPKYLLNAIAQAEQSVSYLLDLRQKWEVA